MVGVASCPPSCSACRLLSSWILSFLVNNGYVQQSKRGAEAVDEADAEVETKRKSLSKTSALLSDQAAPPQQVHDSEADGKVSSG